MTVQDLINRLSKLDPNMQVMIREQGLPREINFGPVTTEVTESHADETADCEDLVGQKVILIGFGSY